ncbi:outer membrane beta-barrel protein [Ferrimonas pelagia]|uniref:Outer membrane beta-barrel protein n=1 Tax=Ferrimonas pelagia TaxID=1177826 RepID=A0ABP9EYJ1_9GAMM
MKRFLCTTLLALSVSAPALAERTYFIAPMAGYNAGGELDVTERQPEEDRQDLGTLKPLDDASYGLMLGIETHDPGNVYLMMNRQSTQFKEGDFGASTGVNLDVDYYHLGGSLFFPRGKFEPYVTASVGVTRLVPDADFSAETRFSLGGGIGARYLLWRNLAVYADIRGYATMMDNSSALVCNGSETDGCHLRVEGKAMLQSQANAGLMIRF